jgi:hypothetical protein
VVTVFVIIANIRGEDKVEAPFVLLFTISECKKGSGEISGTLEFMTI